MGAPGFNQRIFPLANGCAVMVMVDDRSCQDDQHVFLIADLQPGDEGHCALCEAPWEIATMAEVEELLGVTVQDPDDGQLYGG